MGHSLQSCKGLDTAEATWHPWRAESRRPDPAALDAEEKVQGACCRGGAGGLEGPPGPGAEVSARLLIRLSFIALPQNRNAEMHSGRGLEPQPE